MALKKQKKRNKPISWPPGRAHSRKVPIGLLLAPEERNTKLRGDWMERNIAYILVRTLPQVSGSSLQDIHHSPISLLFPNPKCRPDETQNPKHSQLFLIYTVTCRMRRFFHPFYRITIGKCQRFSNS